LHLAFLKVLRELGIHRDKIDLVFEFVEMFDDKVMMIIAEDIVLHHKVVHLVYVRIYIFHQFGFYMFFYTHVSFLRYVYPPIARYMPALILLCVYLF